MKIIKDIENLKLEKKTFVLIGAFDSIHLGHRYLINKMLEENKKYNLTTVLFSFIQYPKNIIYKDDNILGKYILNKKEKYKKLSSFNIDILLEFDFNKIRNLTAKYFIEKILIEKLNTKKIIVGENFKFGVDASGDIRLLKTYFKSNLIVEKLLIKYGKVISTTRIKENILKSKIALSNKLLGYTYFLEGKVKQGDKIGSKIGFPTLNISVNKNKILPNGVFASITEIDKEQYKSITHIGGRPTLGDKNIRIETYLIDQELKDIYNKKICIKLYKNIRKIKNHILLENLKKQIKIDIENVKKFWRCNFDGIVS